MRLDHRRVGETDDGIAREVGLLDDAADSPLVETHLVDSTRSPGGVGEVGTPPLAPALANALFALTGVRLRELPLRLTPQPA